MQLVQEPRLSLRFGNSLEVNILGDKKICSYNCSYCHLGPSEIRMNQVKKNVSFPSVAEIEDSIRGEILKAVSSGSSLDTLLLSGNGEATLHPEFDQIAQRICKIRDEAAPAIKVVILTNGAHIDSRRSVEALNLFDERVIKIDAGSEAGYKQINSPLTRGNLSKVTSGARKLKDCVIQSLFFCGPFSNLDDDELDEWMEVVGIVQPKLIQIHTIDSSGKTTEEGIEPASEDELYTVASKLKRKSDIEVQVFYDTSAKFI